MNNKNQLIYKEFLNREQDITHAPYHLELEFYNAIKSGDLKKIQQLCQEPLTEKTGLGALSESPLQNMKYHFVITTALVTRYCIEGGMDFSAAYSLSDYYIFLADEMTSLEEIAKLHQKMCLDYTKKMQSIRKKNIYSKHISDCIDYIYDNLHTRITIKDIAEQIHISPSYLSRLFMQEVSMSVSAYIQYKKMETAKNMLIYSDYTVSEIAVILAYPSHSYFSEIFKKETHMTPLHYRAVHFHKLGL